MNGDIFEKTMVNMKWPQIDEMARKNALVILPLGVIEEHGFHLPLGTDIYLAVSQAENIADEMAKADEPCVIAPPYYWGTMEVVTKNFPGSFTAKPEHIKAIITDILESLERAGFKRVLSVNAHGDGLHVRTIMTAFKEYNKTHNMNVRWFTFEDDVKMYGLTGKEDFVLAVPPYPFDKMVHGLENLKDEFDVHAGAVETACMIEAFPELTDVETAKKQSATMLKGEQITNWQSGKSEYNSLTPNGHVGDPAMCVNLKTEMEKANRVTAHQIIEFYKR